MWWIPIAFIAPALFAISNIADNIYSNKLFKKDYFATVFYANALKAPLVLLALFFITPSLPPLGLIPYFVGIGILEIAYLVPFFKALRHEDTSAVVALWSMSGIFVPILAFFILGEVLHINQYLGFLIIIFSSTLLSLHKTKFKLTLNKAFFLMILSAFLKSLRWILYKQVFNQVDWSTGFFWSFIFIGLTGLGMFFITKSRKQIINHFSTFRNNYKLIISMLCVSMIGWTAATYATSVVPVSIANGVMETQYFFILFYALIFGKMLPGIFKERLGFKNITKKTFLFVLMVIGVVLLTR